MPDKSMSGLNGAAISHRHKSVFGIPDRKTEDLSRGDRRRFIGLEMVENLVHRGFEVTRPDATLAKTAG